MNDQRQLRLDVSQPHPLDPAIEALRAERDGIDKAIRLLESLRDKGGVVDTTASAAMVAMSAVSAAGSKPTPAPMAVPGDISPGAFHGMSIHDGVRKVLLLRKRTMNAQELSADLRSGGLHFPPKSISSVLHRLFMDGGDIVRMERGQWGLQEWQPNRRFPRKEKAPEKATSDKEEA
jgi:hypothetical protein